MNKHAFIALLAAVVFANREQIHFHGMEDVNVTVNRGEDSWNFQGAITILPHSRNVVLFLCDVEENNGMQNFLEVFGLQKAEDSFYPLVFENKGFLIPFERFEKFVRRDRNSKKLNIFTLTENDEQNSIVIDYISAEDRHYTSQLLEHLQDNLGDRNYNALNEFDEGLQAGIADYIGKFCKRYLVVEQNDDL